ncbi:hypothetical protein OMP38_00440 [Cohnella ginsengisoli]|uniref:Uncharacterized protein n=1 Tax=Cohnella ginsengisoli TaxID=425004 RepID=A0A9X4KCF4_9BACL|nr:hypothetical protein [Cohnella ginsengisoli]MDG0789488.1 hypothetical protein [Cohnella ginsengisoli]
MFRYGEDMPKELKFTEFEANVERRDAQWIDAELRLRLDASTPLPDDVIDLTALVVCTHAGHPIQIEALDEGIDCEYQFTMFEKEQIERYMRSDEVQSRIAEAARGARG